MNDKLERMRKEMTVSHLVSVFLAQTGVPQFSSVTPSKCSDSFLPHSFLFIIHKSYHLTLVCSVDRIFKQIINQNYQLSGKELGLELPDYEGVD
jgi:hypothetical protein